MDADPFRVTEMMCEATVAGEKVRVTQQVMGVVADDPEAYKHIEQSLRIKLMHEILKRWKPVVKTRETGRGPW